jgi:hypothetical protein
MSHAIFVYSNSPRQELTRLSDAELFAKLIPEAQLILHVHHVAFTSLQRPPFQIRRLGRIPYWVIKATFFSPLTSLCRERSHCAT